MINKCKYKFNYPPSTSLHPIKKVGHKWRVLYFPRSDAHYQWSYGGARCREEALIVKMDSVPTKVRPSILVVMWNFESCYQMADTAWVCAPKVHKNV